MRFKSLPALLALSAALVACSSEDPSKYPTSSAGYSELNNEVGCDSNYSDDKKEDIFKSQYKNKWMTWRGEVFTAEADEVSLNMDGSGLQDVLVEFASDDEGYDLIKGDMATVRFVMKREGGCFLPFYGEHGKLM